MTDNFFEIHAISETPKAPEYWSYTSMMEYEGCPRKWMLRRSNYGNWNGTIYPSVPTRALLRGNVVHNTVEEFCREYYRQDRDIGLFFKFFRPRERVLANTDSELKKVEQANPRYNGKANIVPNIEESINLLKNAVRVLPKKTATQTSKEVLATGRKYGPEVEFRIENPRIMCRVDYYNGYRLIDYKTGNPKEEDVTQLQLYAAIIRSSEGRAPDELTLHYLSTNEEVQVPLDLDEVLDTFSSKLRKWDQHFNETSWPANVQESCSYCPVRHLCSEYWSSDNSHEVESTNSWDADIEFQVNDETLILRDRLKMAPILLADGSDTFIYLSTDIQLKKGCRAVALNIRATSDGQKTTFTEKKRTEFFVFSDEAD